MPPIAPREGPAPASPLAAAAERDDEVELEPVLGATGVRGLATHHSRLDELVLDPCFVLLDRLLVLHAIDEYKWRGEVKQGMENATHSHPLRAFRAPTEAFDSESYARLARLAYSLFVAFLSS